MSRSPKTTILSGSKTSTWVTSQVLLAVLNQVDHFLLLEDFLLWFPSWFIFLIFFLPQTAFIISCFYQMTCWKTPGGWLSFFLHLCFPLRCFFMVSWLWITSKCWWLPSWCSSLTSSLSSNLIYATTPLTSLFQGLLGCWTKKFKTELLIPHYKMKKKSRHNKMKKII